MEENKKKKTERTAISHAKRIAYSENHRKPKKRLISREAPLTPLSTCHRLLAVERARATQANQPASRIALAGYIDRNVRNREKKENIRKTYRSEKFSKPSSQNCNAIKKWNNLGAKISKSCFRNDTRNKASSPHHGHRAPREKNREERHKRHPKQSAPQTKYARSPEFYPRLPRWAAPSHGKTSRPSFACNTRGVSPAYSSTSRYAFVVGNPSPRIYTEGPTRSGAARRSRGVCPSF